MERRDVITALSGFVGGLVAVGGKTVWDQQHETQQVSKAATAENATVETSSNYTVVGFSGGDGWQTAASFTPTQPTTQVTADLYLTPLEENSGAHFVRLRNQATDTTFGGDRVAFGSSTEGTHFGTIPENCEGDTVVWEIDPRSTSKQFLIGARWQAELQ